MKKRSNKVKDPVEFGAKLDISVVNGMVRLERQSFETYNESILLPRGIEPRKMSSETDDWNTKIIAIA